MSQQSRDQGVDSAFDHLLDYRARLLEHLEQQPAEFAAIVNALPGARLRRRGDRQGRTIHQVVAHVRDQEVRAFLPRVRRVLAEDGPVLEPYASHHWSDADYEPGEPVADMLAEWAQARDEIVRLLKPLPASAWSRTGFHPSSGNRTLQWWVERAYAHAREHLDDIRQERP